MEGNDVEVSMLQLVALSPGLSPRRILSAWRATTPKSLTRTKDLGIHRNIIPAKLIVSAGLANSGTSRLFRDKKDSKAEERTNVGLITKTSNVPLSFSGNKSTSI